MEYLKKFNEVYSKIILEETNNFNKKEIRSIIKEILSKNYRSVKQIQNGFSFENLIVRPVIIKDDPQHQKILNQYKITFEIADDKLNLICSYNDKTKEKSLKISDDKEKLQNVIEKFIGSSISSLRK